MGTTGEPRSYRDSVADAYLKLAFDSVNQKVSPNDTMLNKATKDIPAYLRVGKSAAQCIIASLAASGAPLPSKILDFGCGWGRVGRWLRALYPDAEIYGCDIDPEGLAFVAENLAMRTFLAHTDINQMSLGSGYDLIFVGSVVTHLDEIGVEKLLTRLFQALAENGVLVITSHGRRVSEMARQGVYVGKPPEKSYAQALAQYNAAGFGFADYPQMIGKGYGISIIQPAWFANWPDRVQDCRLVGMVEAGWNNHQDVISYQRLPRRKT